MSDAPRYIHETDLTPELVAAGATPWRLDAHGQVWFEIPARRVDHRRPPRPWWRRLLRATPPDSHRTEDWP